MVTKTVVYILYTGTLIIIMKVYLAESCMHLTTDLKRRYWHVKGNDIEENHKNSVVSESNE